MDGHYNNDPLFAFDSMTTLELSTEGEIERERQVDDDDCGLPEMK